MPLALATVLRTLSENCQLTSWDIRGKGKMTTFILRFNENTGATEDQHEPVRSVTRYRQMNTGLETSNTGLFDSPPTQYHAHPLNASHRSEELEDGEQNGSDHREDDMAGQELALET